MNRRLTLVPLAAICALGIAACGSDKRKESSTTGTGATATGTTAEKAPTGPVVGTQTVSETEYKLTPANPTVTKAGVVEVKATNDGKIDHAIEVEGQGIEVKSGTIKPGSSGEIKVDLKPGKYEWYCPIDDHKKLGMVGEITVSDGSSSGGSKTTTSSSSSGGGSSSSGGGAAYL